MYVCLDMYTLTSALYKAILLRLTKTYTEHQKSVMDSTMDALICMLHHIV